MLPLYSVMMFFPGGGPASGASVPVTMNGSNVPPLIYQDSAGTLPAANPMVADAMGNISFYAAPGLYMAFLSGARFRVDPDPSWPNPVIPNLYLHTEPAPALVWTIDHHFGTSPSVLLDVGGAQVEALVEFPTPLQARVTFSSPQSGTAYVRR